MPSRHVHHDARKVWITIHGPDGTVVHRCHATGVVGDETLYSMMVDGLRSKLADGETLDTSEADVEHARLLGRREATIRVLHGWSVGDTGPRGDFITINVRQDIQGTTNFEPDPAP